MAQMMILLLGIALVICSIWTALLGAMGASTIAMVIIAILILACCFGSFMLAFNQWPSSVNVSLWSLPIVASAYAIGAPPTFSGLSWYVMCVGVSSFLVSRPRSTIGILFAMFIMTGAAISL